MINMMLFRGEFLRAEVDGVEREFEIIGSLSPNLGSAVYAVTPDHDILSGRSDSPDDQSIRLLFVEEVGESGEFVLVTDRSRQREFFDMLTGKSNIVPDES